MKKIMTTDEINEFIKSNVKNYNFTQIAKMLGIGESSVRRRASRLGVKSIYNKNIELDLTQEEIIKKDLESTKNKNTKRDVSAKYNFLLKENEELKAKIEFTKTVNDINSYTIEPSTPNVGDATCVIVASDWHYWETVNADQVDNLNEFNKEIAQRRAETFFKNSARLIKREQKDSNIKTVVLALLGDFISNSIHLELMESNQGLPIDELMAVQNALVSGLEYLLENTDVDFVLPCHSGNHGRATEKRRISTEAGNSFEYLMYHNIANYFKKEKRLKFLISRGYLSYLDICGYVIRFHHGHALKFQGGIGGIFIPAFKAISQWDKARRADLDVFGHFHQMKDGGKFISNGSLVGYNDFALMIKADYEKPKQVFFIINHKRKEKTTTSPIFLE